MLSSKEDGFATLTALYYGLKQYKEQNPWITKAKLKTDGAGAYSGAVFTLGLPYIGGMCGIKVVSHNIGEAGKNKSQLDGHFAVAGQKLKRLICANLHDVRTSAGL